MPKAINSDTVILVIEVKIIQGDAGLKDAFEIRRRVFIEEQNVPKELELDEMDRIASHFILYLDKTPIGTARLFEKDDIYYIGRMAVLKEYRGRGFGEFIMKKMMDFAKHRKINKIVLHAQNDVVEFYKKFGFVETDNEFWEAGIKHKEMVYQFKL